MLEKMYFIRESYVKLWRSVGTLDHEAGSVHTYDRPARAPVAEFRVLCKQEVKVNAEL